MKLAKTKFLLIIFLYCIQYQMAMAGPLHLLPQQQWAKPKRAETILAIPEIAQVLRELQEQPGSNLLLRYPGGDEGTVWAYELRAWLVSFGVPSGMIEIRPGSSQAGMIEMQVEEQLTGDFFGLP